MRSLRWEAPTPVQLQAVPLLLAGRDVAVQAQTGSGKTAAYGIPVVERVEPGGEPVQALVLVPTRELALQVGEHLRALARGRPIRFACLYGGGSVGAQLDALRRRPQVVVATPGRLLDFLGRGAVHLGSVRMAVLDEADRMLEVGFLPDVERILGATPKGRQTALFSATLPSAVTGLVRRTLRDPVWVRIEGPVPTVDGVLQFYVEVAEQDKLRALRALLRSEPVRSALVFRRTQRAAQRLADVLGREQLGVAALHGGMRQGARFAALRAFASGRTPVLVVTNVASRGLDLPRVSHVVNFDMPEDVETYVHRVGRTARAGATGTAITLVGQYDMEMFDRLQRVLGPRWQRHPLNLYAGRG
ncbi:MAG: DEAD/DEAH box helicase [Firmicutes bacterium]|nr:DEAD/DEAH box helicase [Bacillota bacterium]